MGIRRVDGYTIVKQKGDDIIAIKDSCPKQENLSFYQRPANYLCMNEA